MAMEKKFKVLIVDDETRFRETTAKFLEKRNFDVHTAGSGEQAIEEVKNNNFDVVILDVKMEGLDGNQTLAELKRLCPELEVVMLTAHGSPESACQGLNNGVFDYLAKPCSLNVLEEKILSAGEKKRRVSEHERLVREVMTPLSAFRRLREDQKAGDLIEMLESEESGEVIVYKHLHRTFLVVDSEDNITGVLTLTDLLAGLKPASRARALAPENRGAAPAGLGHMKGTFTIMARYLAKRPIAGFVTEQPLVIDAGATLIEAVTRMLFLGARRLLVIEADKTIGVLREEDLFLELSISLKETA